MVGKEGDLSFQVQNLPDGRDGGSVYAPVSSPKELQARLFKAGLESTGLEVRFPNTPVARAKTGGEFAFTTGQAMTGTTEATKGKGGQS